jgi:phage-related minor tail protein
MLKPSSVSLVDALKKGKEGFDKFKEGSLGAKEGGDKAGGAMDALNKVGPLVAKGIELGAEALKELGKEGLKAALDLDQSTRTIKAQLGATSTEAKKLGDTARAVFRQGFTESITEASQQIVKVKQAFREVGDSITQQNIAEKANGIAKAFGVEFNEVIKAASTASKNFGITSSQALDLVAVAFQKTGDLSGDLLDTINEYSPQFARAGQSADQFIGSLVAGSQAGAFNLDKVADAVKEFTIRIQDGSQTTKEGLPHSESTMTT